jgi:hypothetical protein
MATYPPKHPPSPPKKLEIIKDILQFFGRLLTSYRRGTQYFSARESFQS